MPTTDWGAVVRRQMEELILHDAPAVSVHVFMVRATAAKKAAEINDWKDPDWSPAHFFAFVEAAPGGSDFEVLVRIRPDVPKAFLRSRYLPQPKKISADDPHLGEKDSYTEDEARSLMREVRLEPTVPYLGYREPWPSRCKFCGQAHHPSLQDVFLHKVRPGVTKRFCTCKTKRMKKY